MRLAASRLFKEVESKAMREVCPRNQGGVSVAVKLKAGPILGGSKVTTGPSLKLKTGPSFFSLFFPILLFLGYVYKHK